MIQQLVQRLMVGVPTASPPIPSMTQEVAAATVLGADPFDLMLHMEQVWNAFNPWAPNPPPAGPARRALWSVGAFSAYVPISGAPAWDHIGYSYVLENTRAVQILRRVVQQYRSGESLGIPTVSTQRWLDATESILFGAMNPIAPWLATSSVRQDPEFIRRNLYWRAFGLDLSFGTDDNRQPTYEKAEAANTGFVSLFEELLFELWQAMSNARNTSGVNASDDDRIFRIAEELQFILRSRRQNQLLAREELAAATVLGWTELTFSANTPVVVDLGADATSPSDRCHNVGKRVGLNAHSKSAAFFSMSSDISLFLRSIEAGLVTGPEFAWVLYLEQPPAAAPPGSPAPIGASSRRVITEWAAATGKDLKARGKPVDVNRPRLVAAR
jgi:hypothetical protein